MWIDKNGEVVAALKSVVYKRLNLVIEAHKKYTNVPDFVTSKKEEGFLEMVQAKVESLLPLLINFVKVTKLIISFVYMFG